MIKQSKFIKGFQAKYKKDNLWADSKRIHPDPPYSLTNFDHLKSNLIF